MSTLSSLQADCFDEFCKAYKVQLSPNEEVHAPVCVSLMFTQLRLLLLNPSLFSSTHAQSEVRPCSDWGKVVCKSDHLASVPR